MAVKPRRRPSQTERGLGTQHQRLRASLAPVVAAGQVRCWRCGGMILPGQPWDLGHADHDRSRYMGPEHAACNRATSGRRLTQQPVEAPPERGGLEASDPRWRVPWLRGLLRVPRDATWPRLMTVPHPEAVGSLGAEFVRWANDRAGGELRWWQRLAATRMLEVGDHGQLVWEAAILSMARQLGKSWLLRELCLWRIEQGDRFGESQDVLHTGKDLAVCIEIQRPARLWAKQRDDYKVREANGSQQIEYLPGLRGRWLVKARDASYGLSISLAVVDEAWNVETHYIEEGVVPTIVERESSQLWLVSTAHRRATSLVLTRRRAALGDLESGAGDLLIEWSSPRGLALDDRDGWRLASPHWSARRERLVERRLEAMHAGETQDTTEDDPEESFRAQYLNQWPHGATARVGEDLLPPGLWGELVDDDTPADGPLWVAVEDNFGVGAAVAAAQRLPDGRIDVNGWLRDDWDTALADVGRLAETRQIRQLQVGASMLSRVPLETVPQPRPAGRAETTPALALLRDLAAGGQLVHGSSTGELDEAVTSARVKQGASGLVLVPSDRGHLIRALVWAVAVIHRPTAVPAIF